jgi:hypothetical protein
VAAACIGVWTAAGCSLVAPLSGLTGAGDSDAATTDATGTPEGSLPPHEGGGADGPSTLDHVAPTDSPPPADANGDTSTADAKGDTSQASSQGYKRAITVTAIDAVGAGYTVRFALDTQSLVSAGKALASLADVRVTDSTGIQLDRLVDAPGTTASTVWFELTNPIASGASDTYWVAYGHPDAGAAPANGENVFPFYDAFPGTQVATSRWIVEGAPTVANGTLKLHAWTSPASTQPDALTTNVVTDKVQATSAVEIVASVTNPASPADPDAGFWYWLGYQHQGDFAANAPWILWIARDNISIKTEDIADDAGFTGPSITQDTKSHDYVVARAPSQTTFYRDGTPQYLAALANTTDYSLMLRNFMPQSDVDVTLVRARTLVDHEPTLALGAEQPGP